MTKLFLLLIRLYQKFLSPDHSSIRILPLFSSGCRFHPTCSDYAYQSLAKYGILKGSLLALKRIFRCHPWSLGGYDPVP